MNYFISLCMVKSFMAAIASRQKLLGSYLSVPSQDVAMKGSSNLSKNARGKMPSSSELFDFYLISL
jgi:hypothetical protein